MTTRAEISPANQGPSELVAGLVSTIIPVYNRSDILAEAVQSVLDQDYRPIEIIIIDDGSTDDTCSVAQQLAAENPHEILVLRQDNAGPGIARQHGLQHARGEFIQYLDSDDLLCPQKFKLQVDMLRQHPDCHICYAISHDQFIRHGQPLLDEPTKGTGVYRSRLFPELLIDRWWSTNTPLYRHDILKLIGPWEPLINEEDWEYDARLAARNVKLAWVPESLSIKRWFSVEQHLSNDGCYDPVKLRHRAIARHSIYQSAVTSGVSHGSPEMRHFAHSVFLMARECCNLNLNEEALGLLELASLAGSQDPKLLRDLRIFRLMMTVLSSRRAVRLSEQLHQFRRLLLNSNAATTTNS